MDYEKEYKEALERAKYLKENTDSVGAKDISYIFEYIFPVLKESEDDRIRKYIIWHLKHTRTYPDNSINNQVEEAIAWLEKQDEQKLADKVEPKFKVGDWIVYEGLGTYKVIEIHEGWYSVIDSNDRRWSVMFERESLCHIWTIKDAKDGDILTVVNDERPFIFKGLLDVFHPNYPVAYCGIARNYGFRIVNSNAWWIAEEAEPATKEISDSFLQRIHEEGYEWDAENKKLIHIGNNGKIKD